MLSNKLKSQKGFTIIEVLIVLAIAGMIMLIVFLAVPALQRNNRNTQRNNDVSAIVGGVSEYVGSNNNKLPNSIASGSTTGFSYADSAVATENQVEVKLGFYDASATDVSVDTDGVATNPNNESRVIVVLKGKCNGTDSVFGNTRSVAVLYTTEKSARQCRDS